MRRAHEIAAALPFLPLALVFWGLLWLLLIADAVYRLIVDGNLDGWPSDLFGGP